MATTTGPRTRRDFYGQVYVLARAAARLLARDESGGAAALAHELSQLAGEAELRGSTEGGTALDEALTEARVALEAIRGGDLERLKYLRDRGIAVRPPMSHVADMDIVARIAAEGLHRSGGID